MTNCSNTPTPESTANFDLDSRCFSEAMTSNADYTIARASDGNVKRTFAAALREAGQEHIGEWSTNPLVTESNQVIPYAGTNQLFRPLSLPYQVDSAAHPNPNALLPDPSTGYAGELVDVSKFISDIDLKENQIEKWKSIGDLRGWGVDLSGVEDATEKIEEAIASVKPVNPSEQNISLGMPYPDTVQLIVPYGIVSVTRLVKNSNRIVVFKMVGNSRFTNSRFIDGRIDKDGYHVNAVGKGYRENSSGFSTRAFSGTNTPPAPLLDDDGGTFGIPNPTLGGAGGDLVAQTAQAIQGAQVIQLTGTTFTASTCTYSLVVNSVEENLTIGSILWAKNKNSFGLITDIDTSTNTITVNNWGNGTPTNGDVVHVDFYKKIWASNLNALSYLNDPSSPVNLVGQEIGVRMEQVVTSNPLGGVSPYAWGQDIVNLDFTGANKLTAGQVIRGAWYWGFVTDGADVGFATKTSRSNPNNTIGFLHNAEGNAVLKDVDPDKGSGINDDGVTVLIQRGGYAQWGYGDGSITTIYHDYRTVNSDYDFRVLVTGGSSSLAGQGAVTFSAVGGMNFNGDIAPAADNRFNAGSPSLRFDTVYSVNGVQTTSDARLKTETRKIDDIDVSIGKQIMDKIGWGEWAKDCESNRTHCWVTVQAVMKAFSDHGRDPFDYAMVCYDEWDSKDEVLDHDGNVVVDKINAGSIYSLKDSELCKFLLAVNNKRLKDAGF